ncbi:MAG TPA: biopolymer transporter ExbD [Chryseolinea sp.]|nr:biopolymer transporter ExbD [Chryseolinea sp.]
MDLSSKHKINAGFGPGFVASFVFLLLIFFILTSSFITPTGLIVALPESAGGDLTLEKVSVTITKDLQYFVNGKKVTKGMLEGELKRRIENIDGAVMLYVDSNVPAQHLVYVAGIINSLEARVIIATKSK